MSIATFQILRKPQYALFAAAIAVPFVVLFFYFDQFVFFSPYLVFYLPQNQIGYFSLDLIISALSGVILSLSIFQLLNVSKSKSIKNRKLGVAGIILALFSGACPCYYLVPLLAVAGGAGGALAFIGISLNTYQIPVKLASLALMGFVGFSLERSLKATCQLDYT